MNDTGDSPPAQDNAFGTDPDPSLQGPVHGLTAAGIRVYIESRMDGIHEARRPHLTSQALALVEYYSTGSAPLVATLCGWLFLLCQRDRSTTVEPRLVHEAAFRCDLLGNPGGRAGIIPFPQGREAGVFLDRERRIHGLGEPEPPEPGSNGMDVQELGTGPQGPRVSEADLKERRIGNSTVVIQDVRPGS